MWLCGIITCREKGMPSRALSERSRKASIGKEPATPHPRGSPPTIPVDRRTSVVKDRKEVFPPHESGRPPPSVGLNDKSKMVRLVQTEELPHSGGRGPTSWHIDMFLHMAQLVRDLGTSARSHLFQETLTSCRWVQVRGPIHFQETLISLLVGT
jgi:hypothetical protein